MGKRSNSSSSPNSAATSSSTQNIKNQSCNTKQKETSIFSLFDQDHKWGDKDEVLDAIYWYRQVFAILIGIIWGFLGLFGILGMSLFIIVNSIAGFALANHSSYEFEPDDNFTCVKDGFMTTFATFLVSWTVTYTALHFSHI